MSRDGAAQADRIDVADRKAFLLRVDPSVWRALERLAQAELRSVNAQIEFLLRDALARRGIKPREVPTPGAGARGKMD